MQRNKVIMIGGLVVVIAASLWAIQLLKTPIEPEQMTQRSPEQIIAGAYADAERWQADSGKGGAAEQISAEKLYELAFADLPDSLQGTRMDGGFRLDENGRLIVEPQVVQIFEYFMTSIGEDDLDTIIGRVKNLIEAGLPDSAKADAHRLLAQYLEYRQQQGEIQESAGTSLMGEDVNNLRETFNQVKQVRRDIFGDANADKLFKEDEAYLDFNLNTMEIYQNNESMSELEQLEVIRALAVDLPESHKQVVQEQLVQRELDTRTELLQQNNAPAEEIRLMREQLIGTEAAERLGELDVQREQWQQRVDTAQQDYQAQLADLGDDASEAAKSNLLQSLLAEHAQSEAERKRMKALLGL